MRNFAEKKQIWFLVILMSGIVASIYWRVFSLPFVSDDWWYLEQVRVLGVNEALRLAFDPADPSNNIVYTPLSEAFMVLMYKIYGADPAPMRLPNFLIYILNSCLVVFILGHVLENKWIGLLSGIVYASAIAVHLDVFSWAWAAYGDIGATFFFFLSIWLYLRKRMWMSAFAYLLGCFFKPTIIFLPALLLLHSLVLPEGKLDLHPLRLFNKWLPFLMFGGAVVGLKLAGSLPTTFDEDAPYFIDFWGKHLIKNGQLYLTWMLQTIFPLDAPKSTIFKTIAVVSTLTFFAGLFAMLLAVKKDQAFRRVLFLSAWLVVGLMTVYFLPNHAYRYYSIYSLPAFVGLFFYTVHYFLVTLKVNQSVALVLFSFLGFFALSGSLYQSAQIFDEGLNQNTFADGTNMLIRRATTEMFVTDRLMEDFPSLPPGLVIVLVNGDIYSFGAGNTALQNLFGGDVFELVPLSAIHYQNENWYFETPSSAPRYLDPSLVVIYELNEDSIIRLDLVDLIDRPIEP